MEIEGYDIRLFFNYEPYYLYKNFKTNCYVIYENSNNQSSSETCSYEYLTHREIIIMRYLLDPLLTFDINITNDFSIRKFYSSNLFSSKTINNLLSKVLESITYICYHNQDRSVLVSVYKNMYNMVNRLYNEVVLDNIEYCSTLKIHDFLDIQFNKELMDSINNVKIKLDQNSVQDAYNTLDKVIRSNNNNLTTCYLSGTIKEGQVKQMLAPRGYITEINNTIFNIPVANSFTLGMDNMYYLAAESRSAAKANYFSKTSVAHSEYFAREFQLVCMYIDKLVDGDCKSDRYINWLVRNDENGIKDLDYLIGKIYITEDGKEDIITKNHKHLNGKYVRLRSPLTCMLKDKNCVCTKCFGLLSYNINMHANIGHLCCTKLTQKITQMLLSTKHEMKNAFFSSLYLNNVTSMYLKIMNKNMYYFKSNVINKYSMKVCVPQTDVYIFKDFINNPNVDKLEITRMSKIKYIYLDICKRDNVERIAINIEHNKSSGSFSHDFIKYVRQQGFTLDNNMYCVDLVNFDCNKPFIVMPLVEYSYFNLLENIKGLLKFMDVDKKTGLTYNTPEQLLQNIFDIVNKAGLNMNIALLEIITYAFKTNNPNNNDYSIGRNTINSYMQKHQMNECISSMKDILFNRTISASIAWEYVLNNVLVNPITYGYISDENHPLDVVLCPNEVLADYNI